MPNLLDDAGEASMATMLMMSHHGFRRDIARFGRALLKPIDVQTLRDEWKRFGLTLHGHHAAEDGGIFPDLSARFPEMRPTIERLGADHRRIDPLLEQGTRAFETGAMEDAQVVVRELSHLLAEHLAIEEAEIIPHLRDAKSFPAPATEEETAMYADGFAWASQGIAPEVLEKVYALLPGGLRSRLPAARAAFDARCVEVWGSARAGAARTPIPE